MRIIGGLYKGRNLLPPPGAAITRPITGQVKKSLFGMLGEDLSGQNVVDLYCGTGTLGIEALSRGACRCCFAESDRRVIERLRRNLVEIGAIDDATIWAGDVTVKLAGWLTNIAWQIDVAFVDPPYAHSREWDWSTMVQPLFEPLSQKMSPEGIVTLRVPSEVEIPPMLGSLAVVRQRRYGGMVLALLQKPGASNEQPAAQSTA